jgi:hypothetical protein
MAVILQFPTVRTVRDPWWKKRALLALVHGGLVAAYVVRAMMLIVQWIFNPRSRQAAAPEVAQHGWQLTKAGVVTALPSQRTERRA